MDPSFECNCCSPSSCAACCVKPCASRSDNIRRRVEGPSKKELLCSAKNCHIYGGHDINLMPETQCNKKRNKAKDDDKNSLGSPIGLVTSSDNFKTEGTANDTVQVRYAINLKAFARLHLHEEKTWDSILIDAVMKEGLDLYATSKKSERKIISPIEIYLPNERDILREFVMSDFTFHIELMPKFQLHVRTPPMSAAAVGAAVEDGIELTLQDFVSVMKRFFRQHTYGLITIGSFYAMIWRTPEAYFVFDACGRRLTDFQSDVDKGVAMLMCFKSLENMRHLIVNLSGLQTLDPLLLRELKVVKVVTPQGHTMKRDYRTRTHQYEIINDDYAYLKSSLHLTLNARDLLRNRSGLPVAVAAIVASKIDHPATWDMNMVDRILCFGVNFCQSHWSKCKTAEAIDVHEFPHYFALGQFYITIELVAQKYKGIWNCVPDYTNSELTLAIKEAFDAGHCKLILQINSQMYAIWKKHDFIYLLDPYRHRILGKHGESNIYEEMEKSATVRMFRSFEVFANVLNHILLDSNRTSPFFIHFLRVENIQQHQKVRHGHARVIQEPQVDANDEVLSINEYICFEEAENLCHAVLGEISDYEDDDLRSDVVEIELKTSSSEAEDLMGEEEQQADLNDLKEIESSESSTTDEEDSGRKKPAQPRKKSARKGARDTTRKHKGGKRGDSKKTKKGHGAKDSDGSDGSTDRNKKNEVSDEQGKTDKIMKRVKAKRVHKKQTGVKTEINDNKSDKEAAEETVMEDKDRKEERDKRKLNKKQKQKRKQQKDDASRDKQDSNDVNKGDKIQDQDKDENKEPSIKNEQPSKESSKKQKRKPAIKNEVISEEKEQIKESDQSRDKKPSIIKDLIKVEDQIADEGAIKDLENVTLSAENFKTEEIISKTELSQASAESLKNEEIIAKTELNQATEDESREIHHENEIYEDLNEIENKDEANDSNKENETRRDSNKLIEMDVVEKTTPTIDRAVPITSKIQHSHLDNEDYCKSQQQRRCIPNPDCYPGYFKYPVDMAVVGSESGSYESICKLLQAGFKAADRLLTMTPWGNFVIFRCGSKTSTEQRVYFLFDGCTCNFDRFRHFDLSVGTAGLICFNHIHNVIEYIRHLRKLRRHYRNETVATADDICVEYCNRNFNLRL